MALPKKNRQHDLQKQEQHYLEALNVYHTEHERLTTEIERIQNLDNDTIISSVEGLHWINETKQYLDKIMFVTKPLTLGHLDFGVFTVTIKLDNLLIPTITTNTKRYHPYKFAPRWASMGYRERTRRGSFCFGNVYGSLYEKAIRNLDFAQALQIMYRLFTNYNKHGSMQKIEPYLCELNHLTERQLLKGLFPDFFKRIKNPWREPKIDTITNGLVKAIARRKLNRDRWDSNYEFNNQEIQLALGWRDI